MPRFFFDIANGAVTADDVGLEFPNVHAARDAAVEVLPDVARQEMRSAACKEVTVLLRDAAGRALFTASLTLTARWMVDTA